MSVQAVYVESEPAKRGVSGGILAVVPGKLGIGVWSPGLDVYGNSVRGVDVCYEIADRLGLHVFAGDDEDAVLGSGTPGELRQPVTDEAPSLPPREDRHPPVGRRNG